MSNFDSEHVLNLKRRRAIVVDENPHARKLVADLCRYVGFGATDAVRSTEAAIAHLQEIDYDIVFCDWGMPLSGPDFVRTIRTGKNAILRDLPIVLMKVMPGQKDALEAKAAGASKLLARPFSAQALLDSLPQLLRGAGQ